MKHSPCPTLNPAGTLYSALSSSSWDALWALTRTPFPHPLPTLPEASGTPGQYWSLNNVQAFPHPGLGLALAVFFPTSSSLTLPCCSPLPWKILLVFQLWLKCYPSFHISPPPVSKRSLLPSPSVLSMDLLRCISLYLGCDHFNTGLCLGFLGQCRGPRGLGLPVPDPVALATLMAEFLEVWLSSGGLRM